MSNKTALQGHNTRISDNNNSLETLSQMIDNLPEAGGDNTLINSLLNRTITEVSNSEITTLGSYALCDCTKITSAIFPNITTISSYAFRSCTSLVNFDYPLVTYVGVGAFYNCTKIVSASFPNITKCDSNVFYGCKALTSIDISNVTTIGGHAIRGCTSLTKIDLPACTNIGASGFYGDTVLTTVILRSTTMCTLGNVNAFTGTPIASGTGYVYVPDDLVDDYKAATNWSTYAEQIVPLSTYSEDGLEG